MELFRHKWSTFKNDYHNDLTIEGQISPYLVNSVGQRKPY